MIDNILDILPTKEARVTFIRGLINLSKAVEQKNGVTGIDAQEMTFLRNAMLAFDLSEEEKDTLEKFVHSSDNTIRLEFNSKRQSIFFLREGVQICYIEGEYQDVEQKMIREMASILHISDDTVDKIERWVQDSIELSKRGDDLLDLEV